MMNSTIIKRGLKSVDTFKTLSKRLARNEEILPERKTKSVAKISSSVKLVPSSNDTKFQIIIEEPNTFVKQSEASPILSKILEEEKNNEKEAEAFLGYAIEQSDQVSDRNRARYIMQMNT